MVIGTCRSFDAFEIGDFSRTKREQYDKDMYDEKRRNGELAAAREDGIAEGLAQGHAEGRAEGREEGRAEGLAEGHAEGRAEGRAEAVRMMLAAGIPVETIAGALGISVEECDGYRKM